MPYAGGRYMSEDEYLDAKAEAAMDEYYDNLDEHGWTCSNPECGEVWDPGYVPATRVDPACVKHDYCPRCGSEPVEDDLGVPVSGRPVDPDVPVEPVVVEVPTEENDLPF